MIIPDSTAAMRVSTPRIPTPLSSDFRAGHAALGTHNTNASPELDPRTDHGSYVAQSSTVGAGQDSVTPANDAVSPNVDTPGVADKGQSATERTDSIGSSLADPTLALLADVLDDLEKTRIANENRLRQLTRNEPDEDGEMRGFGLDISHPDVARLAGVVDGIAALEHQATLNLTKVMRAHPLGPWVKAQKGVGDKQAARLLAAIGDPYWHTLEDRPRTVSELWAYCGLHTLPVSQAAGDTQPTFAGGNQLPAGQSAGDTQRSTASGDQTGDSDHTPSENQSAPVGIAAKRKKGERANWSAAAKSRARLIAESMLKAGNRELYDARKAATEGKLHDVVCVRCGPAGKPAQVGSVWSDAHRHADALRIVSKDLLKQLWRAARDLHPSQPTPDTHATSAEVDQINDFHPSQMPLDTQGPIAEVERP